MHKSKLAGFIIDCQTTDLDGAAGFWSCALGMPVRALAEEQNGIYRQLDDTGLGLHVEVQAVTHPSRVHLDIETDDIEAEVRRHEKLGAQRIQMIRSWWVMEAPTGQRYCVIRAASEDFELKASQWP